MSKAAIYKILLSCFFVTQSLFSTGYTGEIPSDCSSQREYQAHYAEVKNSTDLMIKSVYTNDILGVQQALEDKADPDLIDPISGYSMLSIALMFGYTEIVKFLLEAGANPEEYNRNMSNPASIAIENCNIETVFTFAEYGLTYDKIFRYAVCRGKIAIIQELLNRGFDINGNLDKEDDVYISPLFVALYDEQDEIEFLLREAGAILPDQTVKNPYLLQKAVTFAPSTKLIKELLALGADPYVIDEEGNSLLALAASSYEHREDKVKLFLDLGLNINAQNTKGQTPLLLSIKYCDSSVAELLLKSGADCTICDAEGNSALTTALYYDCIDLVYILLDHGIDCNKKTNDGKTALMYAVSGDNQDVVQALLDKGANLNEVVWGFCPLGVVIYNDNLEMGKFLLKVGADSNVSLGNDHTLLSIAVALGRDDFIPLLLEAGADASKLHKAIKYDYQADLMLSLSVCGKVNSLQLLLDIGFDPNIKTANEDVPLYGATLNNKENSIKVLLQAGADPNYVSSVRKLSSLLIAVYNKFDGVAKLLLDAGADPNITGNGIAPLHVAVENENLMLVSDLLRAGADRNAVALNGETPLEVGFRKNNKDIIIALLDAGADPNVKSCGAILLDAAIKNNDLVLVEKLLQTGVSPNLILSDGGTPLALAVALHLNDIISILLQAGADPNISIGSFSLLYLAAERNDEVLVEELLKAEANPMLPVKHRMKLFSLVSSSEYSNDKIKSMIQKQVFNQLKQGSWYDRYITYLIAKYLS